MLKKEELKLKQDEFEFLQTSKYLELEQKRQIELFSQRAQLIIALGAQGKTNAQIKEYLDLLYQTNDCENYNGGY
jgi:DNA-binding NarL/FixJ family response regulator